MQQGAKKHENQSDIAERVESPWKIRITRHLREDLVQTFLPFGSKANSSHFEVNLSWNPRLAWKNSLQWFSSQCVGSSASLLKTFMSSSTSWKIETGRVRVLFSVSESLLPWTRWMRFSESQRQTPRCWNECWHVREKSTALNFSHVTFCSACREENLTLSHWSCTLAQPSPTLVW